MCKISIEIADDRLRELLNICAHKGISLEFYLDNYLLQLDEKEGVAYGKLPTIMEILMELNKTSGPNSISKVPN